MTFSEGILKGYDWIEEPFTVDVMMIKNVYLQKKFCFFLCYNKNSNKC